jgi:hypothetical protein
MASADRKKTQKVLEQFLPGVGNIAELLAQTTVGARPRR